MDKTRILLASLLKPVNEPRMYEKIGKSLTKLPEVDVHICGFRATSDVPFSPNLFLHPLFSFKRLSLSRLTAQVKYLKFLFKLKPNLIIVATHELLAVSIIYKFIGGCNVMYDVQENYYRNLKYQMVYPRVIKQILALTIRGFEWITAPFISHFFLAERSYATQLPFLKGKFTIIENKFKPIQGQDYSLLKSSPIKIKPNSIKLLYTGTISEDYGVFEAIKLAEEFNNLNPKVSLTIIGYCAKSETLEQLILQISDKPFIQLIGGGEAVPYIQIFNAIKSHDIGLIAQKSKDRFTCIPTKFFEYLACKLPMIIQNNPYWHELVNSHQGGIFIDYSNFNEIEAYQKIISEKFYTSSIQSDVFWNSEETKLLTVISSFLNHPKT